MGSANKKVIAGVVSSRTLMIVALCVATFIVGIAVGWWGKQVPQPNKVLREQGYQYIKPILLCNINPPAAQNQDVALTNALARYVGSAEKKDVGVYYLNPTTGSWAGVNENESFSPASMLKVPIMAAVMRSIEESPTLKNAFIQYDGSFNDNALETIKPKNPLRPGVAYSIDDLLRAMIVGSDNNAAHLLTDLLTQKQFETIYTDLGLAAPTVNGPVDFMSPKTFTLFLRVLYNGTYLSREDSEKALSLMAADDFSAGLRAGVPQGTVVANKFGERESPDAPSELHDCGIVYYGDNNAYILCVMTRGDNSQTLASEIAAISNLVYDHVTK